MKRLHWALILCAATIGCSEQPAGPTDAPPMEVSPAGLRTIGYRPSVARRVDAFAQLFAAAMGYAPARAAVHQALRLSPLTEHKLVLSDFLTSPEARPVVSALAAAGSMSENEVGIMVSALPPIDLYVPVRLHRLTWEADQAVGVVPLVDELSPLFAYTSSGQSVAVNRHAQVPQIPMALLMLGPHERATARADIGMAFVRSTSVIEDSREFEIAHQECWEECGGGSEGGGGDTGGGGGSPPPSSDLKLAEIRTTGVYDNGNDWETNEFEIHSVDSYGTGFPRLRCDGVPHDGTYVVQPGNCDPGGLVHSSSPDEVAWIDVWADEEDGWDGNDQFRAPSPTSGLPMAVRIANNYQRIAYAGLWHWDGGVWGCGYIHTDAAGNQPACPAEVILKLVWP